MGRPRKYATNAEKQAAYRERKGSALTIEPAKANQASTGALVGVRPRPGVAQGGTAIQVSRSCSAYVPRGTKCKLCGRNHA